MEEKEKLVTYSARITVGNRDRLEQIKEELGSPTMNDLFENIIDRFYSPIKINRENEAKIKELENRLGMSDKAVASFNKEYSEKKAEIESLQTEKDKLQTDYDRLKKIVSPLTDNTYSQIINFEPLNYLCLGYVSGEFTRQKKCKHDDWSYDMVINYFIQERLIKGTVNGDIDSVPDSMIRKFKELLKNKQSCLD